MEWRTDTQRREVHYSAEQETNGFHSLHGNGPFFCCQTYDKVLLSIKHNYCKVKGEILLSSANRC